MADNDDDVTRMKADSIAKRRDEFAKAALTGIIAYGSRLSDEEVAIEAYGYADAMEAERQKGIS